MQIRYYPWEGSRKSQNLFLTLTCSLCNCKTSLASQTIFFVEACLETTGKTYSKSRLMGIWFPLTPSITKRHNYDDVTKSLLPLVTLITSV